jgi:hypothetical protein
MAVEDYGALHKVAFGNSVTELVPDFAQVQKDCKFHEGALLGDYFEQPVRLALPGGFTSAKGDGTAGGFTLNGATAGSQKKAKVYGYQKVLQDQLPYEDLSKAAKAGAQAYKQATALFWEGMMLSQRKMLEIMSLYGNVGIGKVESYTGGTPSIKILAADWAPQLWAGYEGAAIDVMNGTTSTVNGTANIVSVNTDTRVVTLSATLNASVNDIVYFKGGYQKEMFGLYSILSNTGTIFNIAANTYTQWQSSTHSVGGGFSFQALKKGLAKGVNKGLMYPMNVYCSTGAMDDLVGDIHQLRNVDKSEVRRIELGQDEVVYKFAGVAATIKPHAMVKEGHALGIVPQFTKRVGSADISLGMPGRSDGKIFFDLESTAAVEGRCYSHQGIFSEMPGVCVLWSSIVNRTT